MPDLHDDEGGPEQLRGFGVIRLTEANRDQHGWETAEGPAAAGWYWGEVDLDEGFEGSWDVGDTAGPFDTRDEAVAAMQEALRMVVVK